LIGVDQVTVCPSNKMHSAPDDCSAATSFEVVVSGIKEATKLAGVESLGSVDG
jgi:hypothetical protein